MSDLTHGGPLQVEDLDVTMKVTWFLLPIYSKLEAIRRIVKNLKKRDIPFELNEQLSVITTWFDAKHKITLKVGDREILFYVI